MIVVVVLVIVFPAYVLWQIGGFFCHHNIHADIDWYGRYVVPYNIISFTNCTGEHNKVEYGFSLDYPNELKVVSRVNESWHITDEQDKQIQTLLNRGRLAYLKVYRYNTRDGLYVDGPIPPPKDGQTIVSR